MLDRSQLHSYQNHAIDFIKQIKKGGLFLDMGLGKTATTLTIISDFLEEFTVLRVLIVAPLRVANTVWKQEAIKWKHLSHLDIGICTGDKRQREDVLKNKHSITIINRENLKWLCDNHNWMWDMLVIDESSSFKNPSAKRFRVIKKYLNRLDSTILLTGTPSPQGMMDLWSQIYILDRGERLGKNITQFRNTYFKQSFRCEHVYEILPDAEGKIKSLIKDICITMKTEDYVGLPERIDLYEYIEMPQPIRSMYKELEKEFFITLENGGDIIASSKSVLHNKLLQLCNGAIYDAEKNINEVHQLKIDVLKDIIEDNPNENFIIVYNYKSDLVRLQKHFPKMKVLSKNGDEVDDWNKGKIKMLALHPASAGHGLNMQYGGSIIIWFGLNWSLELYQQTNKRVYRQGQLKPVRIIHIIMKKGLDEKVLEALNSKAQNQEELLKYLKYIYNDRKDDKL